MASRSRSPRCLERFKNVEVPSRAEILPLILHRALVSNNVLAKDMLATDLMHAHVTPIELILKSVEIGSKKQPVSNQKLAINWFEFFEAKFGSLALRNAGMDVSKDGIVMNPTVVSITKLAEYLSRFDAGVVESVGFHGIVNLYEGKEFQSKFWRGTLNLPR